MRIPARALFSLLLLSLIVACGDPVPEEVDGGQDAGWDPSHPRVTELSTSCHEDPSFFNYRLQCRLGVKGCYRCTLLGQSLGGGAPQLLVESTDDCSNPDYCSLRTWYGPLPSGTYSQLIARTGRCEPDAGTLELTDERIVALDGGGC
jgi:hypothetical protein